MKIGFIAILVVDIAVDLYYFNRLYIILPAVYISAAIIKSAGRGGEGGGLGYFYNK